MQNHFYKFKGVIILAFLMVSAVIFPTLGVANQTEGTAVESIPGASTGQNPMSTLSPEGRAIKRNIATIIFASLGGGILGLSTLSFYGKPQEHTTNITTGILLGFVGGVSYLMYRGYQRDIETPESTYPSVEDVRVDERRMPAVSMGGIQLNWGWTF